MELGARRVTKLILFEVSLDGQIVTILRRLAAELNRQPYFIVWHVLETQRMK